jgi:hypothetical protein
MRAARESGLTDASGDDLADLAPPTSYPDVHLENASDLVRLPLGFHASIGAKEASFKSPSRDL